jgi:tetratricopeptide (TPR) repeat protein
MDAKWYKGIVDESIEELKKAATLRPNAWEPHYLLIMEYRKGYFGGYPIVVAEGKPKVLSQVWPFSSQPINADGAIEEFKYLVKQNPDFKKRSKWILGEPSLRSVYGTISSMLFELNRYDEAIIYLEEGVKKGPSDLDIEGDLGGFYRVRANIKVRNEDYDGAIQDYKSLMALRGYRHNEEIQYEDYRVLAGLYAKKGMKKEALEAYFKALEIVRKGKSFSGITKDNTINGLEARIKELQSQ